MASLQLPPQPQPFACTAKHPAHIGAGNGEAAWSLTSRLVFGATARTTDKSLQRSRTHYFENDSQPEG